jgi:hypothetical protein
MLFERRLRDGLIAGTIRVAFRRWRRAQVVTGHRYRLGAGAGVVAVSSVSRVVLEEVSEDDAKRAGFGSIEELTQDLGRPGDGDASLYRIEFGAVETDPRDALRLEVGDVEALRQRVQRIARADETLEAIARLPGVRAPDLAQQLGWPEVLKFKLHVRRLKELGLTISLPIGYRLSPRGEAYLDSLRTARPGRRSARW